MTEAWIRNVLASVQRSNKDKEMLLKSLGTYAYSVYLWVLVYTISVSDS